MIVPQLNIIFRLIDFLLWPFMWILGGFRFPVQESHPWNVKKWDWGGKKGLKILRADKNAKFGHENVFGLYHMPIFGGLTKYVVIEATGFDKYWFVGWKGQIQSLRIKENKIMLLIGKNGFTAYGLGDNGMDLRLKTVGFGELGDGKYNGIRLF